MAFDFHAQIPEDRNPAALGPGHPLGEGAGYLIRASLKGKTQILLEKVGAVKLRVGSGQKLELGLLIFRQMLRIFEESIAQVLQCFCLHFLRLGFALRGAARFAFGQSLGLPVGFRPSLPANLVQRVSGPGNYVERVYAPLSVGAVFFYTGGDPSGSVR